MKKNTIIILIAIFSAFSLNVYPSEWQWSVEVEKFVSGETNDHPRAFLWIPSNCERVRAVVFGQHNMCEETIFEHPVFRDAMSELGFAVVWVSPGFEQQWDVNNGCQDIFDKMLADMADVSGYEELQTAPIVPLGHSAMATFPWNFAAWNSNRTLAVVSYHGDAPRTNLTGYGGSNLEWGRTRNIDGIPSLMVQGEYEWWEARVNPALAFRLMYPQSCISFLCDAGHGHFDVSDEVVSYISLFLKKAARYRLTDAQQELKKVDINKGWLAQRWYSNQQNRAEAAPFSEYEGDTHDAFWYFDEEIANQTEKYYAESRGKRFQYISYIQDRQQALSGKSNIGFYPKEDGVTFNLAAVYSDSLRQNITTEHSSVGKISIDRLCGPVTKVNDTTFTVRFYRMGLNNNKRTGDMWFIAHNKGDAVYKSAVQQLNIRIPYPNKEGRAQSITFAPITNIKANTKKVKLNAYADSGLPVYYYVKEGPAVVDEKKNYLQINKIPPRAKYPIKVTVVAWQYGRTVGDKIQTAEAVERSFYIEK
ncbi:hypothetical protein [Dysgonomonas sp. 216]|uniref:hypothetical protein n=1 Tax=Dysgonomonas sp. 216 TaxID=2302934 RepID=UPI0016299A24|nr:hypothetical protein [Dysgonomonas sp. 216]